MIASKPTIGCANQKAAQWKSKRAALFVGVNKLSRTESTRSKAS
ncbi:hypothetical protein RRSWK_05812 [Rhodopirellula sp. SWK7]|nr:hypothetical protein RRSWK_05812 [Rhodopirellula sp. SWK7]